MSNELIDSQREHRAPLPYHLAIRDYLKQEESAVWEWYASNQVRAEQAEAIRFDLLKSTYRIDRADQPALYEWAEAVATQLELDLPITLYQAQNPQGLNASLAYVPGEAHIVLHGPVGSKLSEHEMRALLAHELGHLLLYCQLDGDLLTASQVLAAMTLDRDADTPHYASARLLSLYNEVYCDRVALEIVNSPFAVISMLVKIATDLDEVNPASYLKQAEEILKKGSVKTAGISHPEAYIRAYVLNLWHKEGLAADAQIERLIEGTPELNTLDLIAQVRFTKTTRRLIDAMLTPRWLHTNLNLAHARLFFEDYMPPAETACIQTLQDEIQRSHSTLRDYYCYVLLDFASADRELEEAPLAQAIHLADQLGMKDSLLGITTKEFKLRKKQLELITANQQEILEAAAKMDTP